MKPILIYSLILFVFLILNNCVNGQPNNSIHRKKGIYSNENDFLTRNSSVKDSFLIRYISKYKQDTSIIGARFYTKDTAKLFDQMWGFCDGENIFIRYPQNMFNNNSCYKLEYVGTLSYFTGIQKKGIAFGANPFSLLITASATFLTAPKEYVTFMIDHKGRVKYLHEDYLIKYFKEFPDLLKSE